MSNELADSVAPPASWSITTWNVRGNVRPDLGAIASELQTVSADVIVLQEIQRRQATELARRLSMRFTWAKKHKPYGPLRPRRIEGLAILTPHALDAAAHAEISNGESNWSWRRRIAEWALIVRPDGSAIRIYNIHLSPHDDALARRTEAAVVSDLVAEHGSDPPAIVAGDFNDDRDATVIYVLPGVEHVVPAPTNPADRPTQILDHVLLPAEAHNVAVTVPGGGNEWSALSDHLPVTVQFALG